MDDSIQLATPKRAVYGPPGNTPEAGGFSVAKPSLAYLKRQVPSVDGREEDSCLTQIPRVGDARGVECRCGPFRVVQDYDPNISDLVVNHALLPGERMRVRAAHVVNLNGIWSGYARVAPSTVSTTTGS